MDFYMNFFMNAEFFSFCERYRGVILKCYLYGFCPSSKFLI